MGDFARRALTGVAAAQAARRGISPDAFDAANQQHQLASTGLLANLLQDPAFRSAATQQPGLATRFGVPLGSMADFGIPPTGQSGTAQPQNARTNTPIFPDSVLTLPEAQRQAAVAGIPLTQARARYLSGSADALARMGSGGPGGGGDLVPTGFGPGGATFGPRPLVQLEPGTLGSEGPVKPGIRGGREVLLKPPSASGPEAQAAKNFATSAQEVSQNLDALERYYADPQFDTAIQAALPSSKSILAPSGQGLLAGTIGRGKAIANQGAGYFKSATDDPNIQYLLSGTRNIIPLIRADAMGTKGMRINLAELNLMGEQAKRLSKMGMTAEEAGAYRDRLLNFVSQTRAQLAREAQKYGVPLPGDPQSGLGPTPSQPGSTIAPGSISETAPPSGAPIQNLDEMNAIRKSLGLSPRQ